MEDTHPRGLAANPGRSRRSGRVLVTAIIGGIGVGLVLWVAPPAEVIDQVGEMDPIWVLAAVALELASCLSYVVVLRRFFPEPPRSVSRRVAWIAMGAGAVLPGGDVSSAAATSWLLRRHGVGTRRWPPRPQSHRNPHPGLSRRARDRRTGRRDRSLSPAASAGAVLVYHAITIWVPGLGGLIAWLPTRRRREAAHLPVPIPALGVLSGSPRPTETSG
ncbi:MAG: hypothetical protein M3010_00025 [Candidatus Dormibacteraeota bacterium]|nr:hypothetical protein [Candidatus Dormibacteraeota bacterium]